MKTVTFTAAALTTLFAFASQAHADENQTTAFEPSFSDRVSEFPWESAFVPSSGPLQVKLGAVAWQDVDITMTGDADYAWEGGTLGIRGEQAGGDFTNLVGAEITATVAYDVFGLDGEIEIGVYSIEEQFTEQFTPYVLAGNADRPLENAFEIGPFNLVEQPFTIGTGSGVFTLDFRIDSPGVTFQGTRVDLATEEGSAGATATIDQEGEQVALAMAGDPGERVRMYGTEYGTLSSEISMHLMPSVSLNIFGLDFTIGPFDIEMAYPLLSEQEIQFDEVTMEFDVPEAPPEPSDDDEDDGGDGGEPSDDDGDDGNEPSDDDDDDGGDDDDDDEDPEEPVGDSLGQIDTLEGDGCGCTSGNAPTPLAFGLIGLGLLGLRRRRNT